MENYSYILIAAHPVDQARRGMVADIERAWEKHTKAIHRDCGDGKPGKANQPELLPLLMEVMALNVEALSDIYAPGITPDVLAAWHERILTTRERIKAAGKGL